MSLSTLKPVASRIPPVNGGDGSHSKLSKVTVVNRQPPPLQVKEKEKPLLQESFTATSRREMMQLTATSLSLLPLLLPASAEARTRNATMRQKILEKLEELRQKAGLSKPKDEGQEKKPKDEVEDKKLTLKNGGDEKKQKDEVEDQKPKLKKESEENKAKLKDGGEGKKPAATPQQPTLPQIEEPSFPALPGIINGKTAETIFP
ncbi:hypothetical protein CDL12_24688 [Handroanthus impetiginosus]|uniref:Uncharacterized protein n=1 Tax=Handroanthus impetiginosus TaxID=429701 RepID=A0A2G9GBW1_9LAMI|nr:hypothetical protein CDL12_24688 [Handroanthus impetiginosus]